MKNHSEEIIPVGDPKDEIVERDDAQYRKVFDKAGRTTLELIGEPERGDAEIRKARRLGLPCVLPAIGLERYAVLLRRKDRLSREVSHASEALHELRTERQSLQMQRDRLAEDLGAKHRRVKHLDRSLLEIDSDLAAANKRVAAAQGPVNAVGHIISNIKYFLANTERSGRLHELANHADEILIGQHTATSIKETVSDLNNQITATHAALYPSADVKELARQKVQRMAAAAAPDFDECLANCTAPAFQQFGLADDLTLRTTDFEWAKLAWLFPDVMTKRFEEEIDARADDEHALSEDERTSKLKELHKKLHEFELVEAELLFSTGKEADLRSDHSPLALLNLRLIED